MTLTDQTRFLSHLARWFWPLFVVVGGSIILSIAVAQVAAILLMLLMLVKVVVAKPYVFRRTSFDIAYIAFVGARIISVFFSVDVETSLESFSKEIVYYGVFYAVTQEFPAGDLHRLRIFLWVLIGAGIIGALYGSILYLSGHIDRATSTTSGPVTLGLYLTALMPFVLVLGRHREFAPKRWMWIAALGILAVGIICTLNRIHWSLLVLMLTLFGFLRDRRLLAFLAVGAILALLSPPIAYRISASATSVREFMNDRNIIWGGAADRAIDRPLTGFGPRTFHHVFPNHEELRDQGVGSWHNDYLQIYMESGLIALVPFLWLMVLVFREGIKTWKKTVKNSFDRDFVLALLFSMGVFYISGLVGGFVIDPLNSLLHRFMLGLLGLMSAGLFRWKSGGMSA